MRPMTPTILIATVLAFWLFGAAGWTFHEDTPRLVMNIVASGLFIGLILTGFAVFAWSFFRVLRVGQDAVSGYARRRV